VRRGSGAQSLRDGRATTEGSWLAPATCDAMRRRATTEGGLSAACMPACDDFVMGEGERWPRGATRERRDRKCVRPAAPSLGACPAPA
jgi:hypothetical protein